MSEALKVLLRKLLDTAKEIDVLEEAASLRLRTQRDVIGYTQTWREVATMLVDLHQFALEKMEDFELDEVEVGGDILRHTSYWSETCKGYIEKEDFGALPYMIQMADHSSKPNDIGRLVLDVEKKLQNR